MFKDVVRSLDVGMLPQVGLVAFVVAFLCVVAYAFWLPRAHRAAYAALPLADGETAPGLPGTAAPGAAAPGLPAATPGGSDLDRPGEGDGSNFPVDLSTPR